MKRDDTYKLYQVNILLLLNGCMKFGTKLILQQYTTAGEKLSYYGVIIKIWIVLLTNKTLLLGFPKKMTVPDK